MWMVKRVVAGAPVEAVPDDGGHALIWIWSLMYASGGSLDGITVRPGQPSLQ